MPRISPGKWLHKASVFIGAALLVAAVSTAQTQTSQQFRNNADFQAGNVTYGEQFDQILQKLREETVNPEGMPTDDELFRIAIQAIMKRIGDKHGTYFDAEAHERLQASMNPDDYEGVGIKIAPAAGGVIILEVFDNSPLRFMNVKVGDVITGAGDLGGEFTEWNGSNLKALVGALKGPAGSDVNLKLKRGGTVLGTITVQRVTARSQFVFMDLDDSGILTVRITSFSHTIDDDIKDMLEERELLTARGRLDTTKVKGLVLDLRNNPGGVLTSGVSLGDTVIAKDRNIVRVITAPTDESGGRPVAVDFPANSVRLFPDTIPRVALGNGGSASASEIVIGALVKHKEMPFFGQKTYGKGSVQTILPLAGGAAMKTTTAIYLAGGDMEIDGVGVEPTSPVPQPPPPGLSQDQKRLNRYIIRTSMDEEIDYQLAVAKAYIRAFLTGGHSMDSADSVRVAIQKAHGAPKANFVPSFCEEKGLRGCPRGGPPR